MEASVSQGGADSKHVGMGDEFRVERTQMPPENEGVPMLTIMMMIMMMMMMIVMAVGHQ